MTMLPGINNSDGNQGVDDEQLKLTTSNSGLNSENESDDPESEEDTFGAIDKLLSMYDHDVQLEGESSEEITSV